jgi:hypothetical protein
MNSEEGELGRQHVRLSLEDLEKKYFKNNQNYYTSKQPSTNFEKLEFNDKDMEVLRSQMGDQSQEIASPEPEVAIIEKTTDNPIDVAAMRGQPKQSLAQLVQSWRNETLSIVYLYFIISAIVAVWTLTLWVLYFSFSLFVCFSIRVPLFVLLYRKRSANENLVDAIRDMKGWILKGDILTILWAPVKGLILSIIIPHEDWSPLAQYSRDNFPAFVTFLMVINYFIARRVAV